LKASKENPWNVVQRLPAPFVYLLGHNEGALELKPYMNKYLNEENLIRETLTLDSEVFVPYVEYYGNHKNKAELDFYILHAEPGVRTYHSIFIDGNRVIVSSIDEYRARELQVSNPFSIGIRHAFPPFDFDSFLFFELNPEITKAVMEFISRHESKLTPELVSNIEMLRFVYEQISKVDSIPETSLSIEELKLRFAYARRKGLVRVLMLMYSYDDTITTDSAPEPSISVSFIPRDGSPLHKFMANLGTSIYISRKTGLYSEITSILRKLESIYSIMTRGALIFGALKKYEEV